MIGKEEQIIIFLTEDGEISLHTRFDEETAWLSLDQMADLIERDKSLFPTISKTYLMRGRWSGIQLLQI